MRPHVCRTRNQSTSKESRLNKFDPVRREGGFASLSTCSPTRVFDPRLFANQRFALRLGSTTLACSQVYRLDRKHSVCSAKIAGCAVDPPPLRPPLRVSPLANLRFALRLGSSTLAWAQYDSGQILKIIDRDEVLLNQSLSFQMNEIFFFRERTIDKRHQISFFIKFHLMRHF